MINLEIFGEAGAMRTVAGRLDGHDGVSRVRVVSQTASTAIRKLNSERGSP
jgi:hypothetical protein